MNDQGFDIKKTQKPSSQYSSGYTSPFYPSPPTSPPPSLLNVLQPSKPLQLIEASAILKTSESLQPDTTFLPSEDDCNISKDDLQIFWKTFHTYSCPKNSELTLLGGALKVKCGHRELKVKARLCEDTEFDIIVERMAKTGQVRI